MRTIEEIEHDLAVIELAFVSLMEPPKPQPNKWAGVPLTEMFPALKKLTEAKELALQSPGFFKRPDLPRCSEMSVYGANYHRRGKSCSNPATYPGGLCQAHWRKFFGHEFVNDYRGHEHCTCGRSRRISYPADPQSQREICPLKQEQAKTAGVA